MAYVWQCYATINFIWQYDVVYRTWRKRNGSFNTWYLMHGLYHFKITCLMPLFHVKPEPPPMDCMDVFVRCCQAEDCLLLSQIKDLFQCVEVLRKPPEEPPYCTSTCRNLVSDVLATEYGLDLLSCNCSGVKEGNVPKINYLCQPFQSNALTKCAVTTPSPSGK